MTLFLNVLLALAAVLGLLLVFTWRTARRVEGLLPPQGRFIDVPGARLHVVDSGQGTPVLMVHGLAGQLRHFTYGITGRLVADCRVIAVDRPGSGYSQRSPGASATLGAQADALAALIDTLHLDRPVVVGHSLGGAVALTLAQRHPDKVRALALVAPLTHEPSRVSPVFKGLAVRPWLRAAVAWTLALPMAIVQRAAVLDQVFGPEAVPDDAGTRGGALLGVRPSHFIAASTDLAALPADFPAMLAGYPAMRLPVQVLYGRGDRILDAAEQGQALVDRLPGARLVLIDGGHMLPVTQPARTAEFIADVVRQTAGTPQAAR